jgi:hypothetical protein
MCQRAFGNAFGPLVTAPGLVWTRGSPRYFQSSNRARRGFCQDCGTPLSYEPDDADVEVAFCTLDDPSLVQPVTQVALEGRLPWVGNIDALPQPSETERAAMQPFLASIQSYQYCATDRDEPG